jgi:chemotaxis protein MotB
MRRGRRKHRSKINPDRWLVSYADFVTLLFAFFVVMFATAQIDKKKSSELSAAMKVAFQQLGKMPPPVTRDPIESRGLTGKPAATADNSAALNEDADQAALHRNLERALAAEIARGEVALHNGPDGLVISLREVGFFDSGSAGIKTGSQQAINRMALLLAPSKCHIRIEGHTDNVPIHNSQFTSNWELSTARSTEMIRLLVAKYGFSPVRLSASGYAEYYPVADNATAAGRALNRRVDLVVLSNRSLENNSLGESHRR